jgi:hypothetical protein
MFILGIVSSSSRSQGLTHEEQEPQITDPLQVEKNTGKGKEGLTGSMSHSILFILFILSKNTPT